MKQSFQRANTPNELFQNDHARAIENAATEGGASDRGAGTESTGRGAETETGSATGSGTARGRGTVTVTGNAITVNHIRERDHGAGRGIVNVREIASIESEAEKKGKLNISRYYFNRR